jgi:hypothetical protein
MQAKIKEYREMATGVSERAHRGWQLLLASGTAFSATFGSHAAVTLFLRGHSELGTIAGVAVVTAVASCATLMHLRRRERKQATSDLLMELMRTHPEERAEAMRALIETDAARAISDYRQRHAL